MLSMSPGIALLAALSVPLYGVAQSRASIILATTTSTQDSGLLDVLVPRFEQEHGIDVKVIAVGTGAALRMAARGDADVVLVHAPAAERPYVDSGRPCRWPRRDAQRLRDRGAARDPAGIRQRCSPSPTSCAPSRRAACSCPAATIRDAHAGAGSVGGRTDRSTVAHST